VELVEVGYMMEKAFVSY
jgi:hypothetical protein